MSTPRALGGVLVAAVVLLVALLQACSGSSLIVRHVPEDGYESTINYQFQARVHDDADGNCQMMQVRVRALNKIYSRQEPPPRLQLFDDDCGSPLRFERVQYVDKDTGSQVRLHGTDVNRFLGDYSRLEDELVGWLWREGVI